MAEDDYGFGGNTRGSFSDMGYDTGGYEPSNSWQGGAIDEGGGGWNGSYRGGDMGGGWGNSYPPAENPYQGSLGAAWPDWGDTAMEAQRGNIGMPKIDPTLAAGLGGPGGIDYEAQNQAAIDRMVAEIDAYNRSKSASPGSVGQMQMIQSPQDKPLTASRGTRTGGSIAAPLQTFDRPAPFTPELLGPAKAFTPTEYKPGQFSYSGPEFKLPEYALPEEDKKYELRKREEFAASSRRMLGQKSNEALLTTRNIDNPTARAKALQSIVQGYGQGMENVMREAGGAASRSAAMKRSEQIQEYAANWSAQAETARVNYNQNFNTQLQNFMLGEQAKQSNIAAQNQAGLFNLQNEQAIAEKNVTAKNAAKMADWQLSAAMYQKSPGAGTGTAARGGNPLRQSYGGLPNIMYAGWNGIA